MPRTIHATSSTAINRAFMKFDEALLLDPRERQTAIQRHNDISEALTASTLFTTTFLQGSFARKTMLSPLTDVDVVAVYQGDRRASQPRVAMHHVKDPILRAFPEARFDQEKQPAKAVTVTFPDVPFAIDITVAIPDPSDADIVWIANRETNTWQRSATKRVLRLVRERNKATNGSFVHQVRMLKAAKNNSSLLNTAGNGKAVCGLLMESLTYNVITTDTPHPHAIAAVLAHAADACTGPIYDPANETDLTSTWTHHDRTGIVNEFQRLADRANVNRLRFDAVSF